MNRIAVEAAIEKARENNRIDWEKANMAQTAINLGICPSCAIEMKRNEPLLSLIFGFMFSYVKYTCTKCNKKYFAY